MAKLAPVSEISKKIPGLIEEVKEAVNCDLSDAIEDLDSAGNFFEALDELESLSTHLTSAQKELLGLAQVVRRSLETHVPFISSVLENSERVNR
ncbi:hypothetical protein A2U01_0063949, partial [Trifolium medium]|nr:hypothetical protein [Trifolium medium]